jgi:hypothetical protein
MLTALWDLSAAIRGYLRFYMPTNRAVDWFRSPRGLKWAIPVALVVTPAYLGLTALAIQGAARPGLGWLNVLVFLFFWNAMKFAWMAVLSPLLLVKFVAGRVRARRMLQTSALAGATCPVRAPRNGLAGAFVTS